jgi:Glycosyltransferase family 87
MIQAAAPRDRRPETGTLRAHALVLMAVLWGGAIWLLATPGASDRFGQLKAPDFSQFFMAGKLALTGRIHSLYDWPAFALALRNEVPGIGDLLYLSVYPPQVAVLFAPLAALGYAPALIAWTVCSTLLYGAVVYALTSPFDRMWRLTCALLALGNPAFQQTILHGQISTLALAAVLVAWRAWHSGHLVLAGIALGSLVFKPQLLSIALAAIVLRPSLRLAWGVAAGAVGQCALTACVTGVAVLGDFARAAARVLARPEAFEPKPWQLHSLKGAIALVVDRPLYASILWGLCVALTLLLASRAIRATRDRRIAFSAVIVAGLLIDPHLYGYDLVILTVPLALIADVYRTERGGAAPLAYALFWAPLVGPFAALTHVQLTSPLALAWLWRLGQDAPTTRMDESVRPIAGR